MPPKGKRRGGAAAAEADAAASSSSSSARILLVNSGPVWLEVSSANTVNLNRVFGPGVTLRTATKAAVPTGTDFAAAVATATDDNDVVALLPGADGALTVVSNGAYECVRLIGTVRAAASV